MTTQPITNHQLSTDLTTTDPLYFPYKLIFKPEDLTLYLDALRGQLEAMAANQGLTCAFLEDGQLDPAIRQTGPGCQFEHLTGQLALVAQVKENLPRLAKASAATLVVGGAGLAAVQAHRRGWTTRLAATTVEWAGKARGLAARLHPPHWLRRRPSLPANIAAAFARDLAGTGQPVTIHPHFFDDNEHLDQTVCTGPLYQRRADGHFVVAGPQQSVIFPPEAIVNVALTVSAAGPSEAIITVDDFWMDAANDG